MGLRICFEMVQFFIQTFGALLNEILEKLETVSLFDCLQWVRNKKHPSAGCFSQAQQVAGFLETHSLLCPPTSFLSSFYFPSQRRLTWLTSHLKHLWGVPFYGTRPLPLLFPWRLAPSLAWPLHGKILESPSLGCLLFSDVSDFWMSSSVRSLRYCVYGDDFQFSVSSLVLTFELQTQFPECPSDHST